MRRAGVSTGSTVVVYDEADATVAARAWWLLRYFGHGDCRVLDGGFRAWAAAGGQVTTGDSPAPGRRELHREARADAGARRRRGGQRGPPGRAA